MNVLKELITAHLAQLVRIMRVVIIVFVQQETAKVLTLLDIYFVIFLIIFMPDGCVHRKEPYPNNSVRYKGSKKCSECTCNVRDIYVSVCCTFVHCMYAHMLYVYVCKSVTVVMMVCLI